MKKVAIGIDIGGTNTMFGIVDSIGNCLVKKNILTTDFETPEKLIITIYKEVQVMLLSLSDVIPVGIGIGAPNGNYYNGTIEYAPNLKWKGVINLIQLFRKYFDIPVYVTNDANAAAIGEMTYGVAKNSKDFVIITLGTGLGSGIVCNGQLVYGHDGFAGELGHTIVEENGRECACGRKGCLETYVSATGIVRTAHIMLAEHSKPSLLRKTSDDKITAKTIAEAAQKGDALALDIFDFTAKKLGLSLSNLVAITSPEMIVLFGGLANSGESILDPTQKYMEENLLLIFKNKIKIIPSSIKGNEAAIMGASSLVWNELKKEQLEKTSLN
jgi:glucokinase